MMLKEDKGKEAKRDIKTCQHLSERSFATSKRYGYKRARWRRLWRMVIQDFFIAAIQNITVLIAQPKHRIHRISKSNVQIDKIGNYLKEQWQGCALTTLIKKVLHPFKMVPCLA
jgi:hypothetical protein